jgi:hypothetical protein
MQEFQMQLRQLHALGAAQSAYRVLTANPPLAPLASMPAPFTQQVQTLGTLISQVETQAATQASTKSGLTDKVSVADAAAKELSSGLLKPLRKMAKIITQGSVGGAVNAALPTTISIPQGNNQHALIAAARAAVTNVTPYKDLFVARGMADDFLDQISAQADALTQAMQAVGDTKTQRASTTTSLQQLFKQIHTTIQVLDVSVQRACKADSVNGPATKTAWETAKSIRKAPMPTDISWPQSVTTGTTAAQTSTAASSSSAVSSANTAVATTPVVQQSAVQQVTPQPATQDATHV